MNTYYFSSSKNRCYNCYLVFQTKYNSQKNFWWNGIYRLAWEYWFDTEEAMVMRKILALILGCKRIHKPGRTVPGFLQIFMELCQSKAQLAPPHGNPINGAANPEIVYMLLLFQILCIDWFYFFLKYVYFERKFTKYLMELAWVGSNHLKVFRKIDAVSS